MSATDQSQLAALRERAERDSQRITELEIEVSFHKRASEELDEVVREQGLRMDRLERRIAELIGELELNIPVSDSAD